MVVWLPCPPGGDATENTINTENKQKEKINNNRRHHQEQARHPSTQTRLLSQELTDKTKKTGTQTQQCHLRSSRSSFAVRVRSIRQVVRSSRSGTLLPCLPSPSCFVNGDFHSTLPPALPTPLDATYNECVALLVPPDHESYGCIEFPRYHLLAFFPPTRDSAVSTPNTNRECSVDPSRPRNTLRPSSTHLRQVFECPPAPGPTPPDIVPNATRRGNGSSHCRAAAPAKKSRRLRVVVSMLFA